MGCHVVEFIVGAEKLHVQNFIQDAEKLHAQNLRDDGGTEQRFIVKEC
jgi:hypothetical protein